MMLTESELRAKLAKDTMRAGVALHILYVGQTDRERQDAKTYYLNQRGFCAEDAPVLTPLAQKFLAYGELDRLEWRELFCRLPKYSSQVHRALEAGRMIAD